MEITISRGSAFLTEQRGHGRGLWQLEPRANISDAAARCCFEKAREEEAVGGAGKKGRKSPLSSYLPAKTFARAGCLQSRRARHAHGITQRRGCSGAEPGASRGAAPGGRTTRGDAFSSTDNRRCPDPIAAGDCYLVKNAAVSYRCFLCKNQTPLALKLPVQPQGITSGMAMSSLHSIPVFSTPSQAGGYERGDIRGLTRTSGRGLGACLVGTCVTMS